MLKLKNISKYYKNGNNKTIILDNVNISFREHELVFILGRSGSGKSTLLNIIGGILKSDSGEILFGNYNINKFNDKKLDNYRNRIVGFIFQDYNLIEYMTVSENIKLIKTINRNNNRMDILLKQLNIYDKRNVKICMLSGGEKQRVAIARALINDPKILLCDEPTGALDSNNGMKIMDILKQVSNNKLVIVVSHDNYLANKYADRIINLNDGIIKNNFLTDKSSNYVINKKYISLVSIFKIAFKNLLLKKWRTVFTSFAISLGITCMMLVVSLSNSFNVEIEQLQNKMVSMFPINISNGNFITNNNNNKIFSSNKIIINKNNHVNKIDNKYIDYLNNIKDVYDITYKYDISMPLISSSYKYIDNKYFEMYPKINNYSLLSGNFIKNIYDIVLLVDENNQVSRELLNYFNIDNDINYDDIIGKKIKIITNDNYYINYNNMFLINNNIEGMYKNSNIELTIVGVVKEKDSVNNKNYLYYDRELINYIINNNKNSLIVNKQLNSLDNVLNINIDRMDLLSYLGYNSLPIEINIYTKDLESKKNIINKLNGYKDIIYFDTFEETIGIIKNLILIISIILIMFSIISILISSLMIFILTNTRVIERYREIGILRSFGCGKRDIIKMFNFENFFIGVIASIIGILNIYLLKNPINFILNQVDGFNNIFNIDLTTIIVISIINIIIIVLSGYLPVKKASNKQIVDCIYNK